MPRPAFAVAQAVAAAVQEHFAKHPVMQPRENAEIALAPTAEVIAELVDAAFWASLRREEGVFPRISLALLPQEQSRHPLRFERPLPLAAEALTKLAPAVERPGIHLGVWDEGQGLAVWGTTHTLPPYCFVLEVSAPGMLVLKHSRSGDGGKFVNVAVIEGAQVKVLSPDSDDHSPAAHFDFIADIGPRDPEDVAGNLFVQLAVSIRAHARGGALIVVPEGDEEWRESIVHPVLYSVSPTYSELRALVRTPAQERTEWRWHTEFQRAVDLVGGLTAVDGATIISAGYQLLAFGAKIRPRDRSPAIDQVLVTEPVHAAEPRIAHPEELGGTRHLSAAQFAFDQHRAVALVASVDGRFTRFSWSHEAQMVQAHRLEMLLL